MVSELNCLLDHLYTSETARSRRRDREGTKTAAKKYLTSAGVLLLIREVRCGILELSEGHAPHCPKNEL
jgi:hypothetical protein